MSVVTLVSGGLDSTVVAALTDQAGAQQFPLFVDYGHLAADTEWATVSSLLPELGLPHPTRMDLQGFGNSIPSGLTDQAMDVSDDAFLPTRNLLLLTVAAGFAYTHNAQSVAIGLLSDATALFPDQTTEFVSMAQAAIDTALGEHIEIVAPLGTMTKGDVIRLAERLGIDRTYSCHSGGENACGRCVSCRERMNAINQLSEG